jgi:hypothetical protein
VLNSPAVSDPALGGSNPAFGTARDVVGIVLWVLGLAIETVTDTQKARRHILSTMVVKLMCARSVALQIEEAAQA